MGSMLAIGVPRRLKRIPHGRCLLTKRRRSTSQHDGRTQLRSCQIIPDSGIKQGTVPIAQQFLERVALLKIPSYFLPHQTSNVERLHEMSSIKCSGPCCREI